MNPCVKHPRSPDSSDVLTEARTVLMRAESALRKVASDITADGRSESRWDSHRGQMERYTYETDPDAARVVRALGHVVMELDHWRKCRADCEGRQ